MKSRARGFTMLESLITIAVLGGLILVVFAVFEVGVSGFKLGNNRLELQGDLRRLLAPLRKDLLNSSYQSVSTLPVTVEVPQNPPFANPEVTVHRDGLCFNGLRDMSSADSYNADSGLPEWDCYVCYFATKDSPDGKLARILLKDPAHTTRSDPRNLQSSDLSLASPDILNNSVKVLSDRVMEFEATQDESNQVVNLHIRMRSKVGHHEMGGRSTVEILEIRTAINPTNTFPRY